MDRLTQAKALLAALQDDERRTLFYEPKGEPWRDEAYRDASNRYGDAANSLEDWLSEWLEPALEAEGRAECVEPELPFAPAYTRSARSLEHV